MPTRTTTESDGVAVPPLLVPVEGRPGKAATTAAVPLRTQTTRNETGYAVLPFLTPLRGGGDKARARPVDEPLTTVTAGGNHHGLALPPLVMRNMTARGDQAQMSAPATEPIGSVLASSRQSLISWQRQLMVPYYGSSASAQPAADPVGALTTRDRYGIARSSCDASDAINLDDVLFRMLEPHEIGRAMAFLDSYQLAATSKRTRTRLYGNAVTPPVAEVIVAALVEAITGDEIALGGAA
jgi:DNA (cytosine-5)-methyltransferase 1